METVNEITVGAGLTGRGTSRGVLGMVGVVVAVVVAALLMVGTLPGRTHGLGLITESLLADLQIDRTSYAKLNLIATLIGATFCWPCGWMIDRIGIRWVSLFVLVGLGLVTIGTASVQRETELWILTTLSRGFGQSMLSVVSLALVGKCSIGRGQTYWMAVYSLLVSLLFIAAFQGMGQCLPVYGWRTCWATMGYGLMISAFLVVWAMPSKRIGKEVRLKDEVASTTFREAVGTFAFWVMAISAALYAFVSSGLALFNQSILVANGLPKELYFELLSVSTFAGMLSNMLAGWVARWVAYQKLMAIGLLIYLVGLLAFPWIETREGVLLYAVGMGITGGIVTVVFFGVWAHAYGRAELGQIQGLAQLGTVLGSAAGPVYFAICFDWYGSYTSAFFFLAPWVAAFAGLAWFLRLPVANMREDVVDGDG